MSTQIECWVECSKHLIHALCWQDWDSEFYKNKKQFSRPCLHDLQGSLKCSSACACPLCVAEQVAKTAAPAHAWSWWLGHKPILPSSLKLSTASNTLLGTISHSRNSIRLMPVKKVARLDKSFALSSANANFKAWMLTDVRAMLGKCLETLNTLPIKHSVSICTDKRRWRGQPE